MGGQFVVAVCLLGLCLLLVGGLFLEYGTDLLDARSPLERGPEVERPDENDGNVIIDLGESAPTLRPRSPIELPEIGQPSTFESALTPVERSQVSVRGYLPYVVKRGDRLEDLAEHYLGKAELWRVIQSHNSRIRSPDDLREGVEIRIPLWLREDQ